MSAEWSLIRARLSSEELAQFLNSLRAARGCTYRDLIKVVDPSDALGWDVETIKRRLGARARFSDIELKVVAESLHMKLTEQDWQALQGKHAVLMKQVFQPSVDLPNALVEWTGTGTNQDDFVRKRTGSRVDGNKNGQFLNLRISESRTGEPRLLSSLMFVSPPTTKSPMPQFLTRRRDSSGRWRSVRGVIFERGNLIYSIGRARHLTGFRTTMLKGETRGADRNDMFGVRLGIQESPDQPFAYPIYCYQLKSQRSHAVRLELQGDKPLDDPQLHDELKGLPTILERLEEAAANPLGCRFS